MTESKFKYREANVWGSVLLWMSLLIMPASAQHMSLSTEVIDSINGIENVTTRYFHIDCVDEFHCIVAGEVVGGFRSGIVDHSFVRGTTDGGESWYYLKVDSLKTPDDIEDWTQATRVAHPTPDLMLVATRQGVVHRSDDGGGTWVRIEPYPDAGYLNSLNMFDENHGVIRLKSLVLYTDDGGVTWRNIVLPDSLMPDSNGLGGVVYVNLSSPQTIVVSARIHGEKGYGGMAITRDFGKSWNVAKSSNEGIARYVFIDSSIGWASGIDEDPGVRPAQDLIMRTTNGGLNWVTQLNEIIDPPYGLANIDFYDHSLGIAAGAIGKLLVTMDGGGTWKNVSMDPARVSGFWGVSFPSATTAFLAGGNGTVVKVTFGTASVKSERESECLIEVVQRPGSIIIRASRDDLRISEVDIVDVRGLQVAAIERLTNSEAVIPVDKLQAGAYFVVVNVGGRNHYEKFFLTE